MRNIFDSHAHYDDKRFDGDRDAVLSALPTSGVRYVMNAASDLASAETGVALADRYDFMYCSVGVHPHEAKEAPADLEARLRRLAAQPKALAIGEIGLDYHYDFSPRDIQRDVFRRQLALALALDLPVIVHDREAHRDIMDLLRELRPRGVVHCFSGSAEMAKEIVELGMYVGFTGAVTFKNARKPLEAAAAVPLHRLLIETDCPYMAPEPYRGKRCDSSMLDRVAGALADVKGISPQELADAACRNACDVYGIPPRPLKKGENCAML